MPNYTKNLNLFKYDLSTDGDLPFDVQKALNDNWDILDIKGAGSGYDLFDTKLSDHILNYEESKGWGLQGTYVYKEAIAGSRYGYPDFYNKCLEEYQNSELVKQYIKSNITLNGSTTDNEGVISGFSSTSWAIIPNGVFNPGTNNWEMVVKFTTGTIGTSQHILNTYNMDYQPFQIAIAAEKTLNFTAFKGNANNTIVSLSGTTILQPNMIYFCKASYDNINGYKIEISTDGISYTTEASSSVTTAIDGTGIPTFGADFSSGGKYYAGAFTGSVDLKECYINIAREGWWKGADVLIYKQNTNGHRFYDITNKSTFDDMLETDGTAWFYGVDTENERIFLPRNNYFDQATSELSEVGKSAEAGLPNITGSTGMYISSAPASGAFAYTTSGCSGANRDGTNVGIDLDASRCSSVYGNSDTVQPNAVKKLLYICVGNTESQNAVMDVIDVTTTENDTTPLFTARYFDFKPNNISWLIGGQQVNNSGIYTTCYNELVNILNGETKYKDLKVVNEANMLAGVDYSEYWKVNQDEMYFITPIRAGLFPNNRILVSKKIATNDDPTWYNLYSDGWCEQGGYFNSPVYHSTYKVDLLIEYIDANYSPSITRVGAYNANAWGSHTNYVDNISTTSFEVFTSSEGGGLGVVKWQACGYTEIPNVSEHTENVNLYFKVANAVQNLELLDAGEVLESLADKISHQDCKAYITETYVNGTSGYNVYSNGYCEQWGCYKPTAAAIASSIITLLKPYKSTNYNLSVCQIDATSTVAAAETCGTIFTNSTFGCAVWGKTGINICWKTCGYLE